MLQIKSANPDVVALNSGGDDTANAVKSAANSASNRSWSALASTRPALIRR
jgi:ABC-type branched-subunit amino acid transport system substrate-binding protein